MRPLFQGVLTAAIALGLASCSPKTADRAAAPASKATDLSIVTTTLPVTDFTQAIVGDRAEVTYLLPTNVGPHDYQAKPEDVRRVAEADVLVKNGLGLEGYLDNLIANANHANLKIIDSSQGVQTIAVDQAAENHSETELAAEDHDHGTVDPHIWLDPKRAIQQVENIRDGLIAADPADQATYTANAAAYIEQLKALDAEITTALQPYSGQEFVTYHDFAFYFAQSYGLKAAFLVGLPEENPSPDDVQRVMQSAAQSKLKVLLTEPQASGSPFSAIAKDLKVQISVFDPMETGSPDGIKPDYYLTVMRQNVNQLKAAFGGSHAQPN